MSSSEVRHVRSAVSRRRLLAGIGAALVVAPALVACGDGGFRPMYSTTSSGVPLQQRMAQLEFAAIPGRVGQRIRNELIFGATGGGDAQPPTHRVDIAIRESVTSTLVRSDGESLSQVYNLEASFKLIRLADKKVVFEGKSHGRAAFERSLSIFANVRAREDAENRAARTISGDLKTRLAAFMSGVS